ncbi:MAG TPA: hypothetical protein VHA80_01910 [Solirubrobacterales bacterium]|nr:hypothetical protein [Solirubrobacterales bacterium]
MTRRRRAPLGALVIAFLLPAALAGALPSVAAAQGPGGPGGPRWTLTEATWPTNWAAGEEDDAYVVVATNVGGEATSATEPVRVQVDLPAGTTFVSATMSLNAQSAKEFPAEPCSGSPGEQVVHCELEAGKVVNPGEQLIARVVVDVDAGASGTLTGTARIEGGGVPPAQAQVQNQIGAGPPAPGVVPGTFFSTVSTEQAGAHPNASAGFTLTTTRHRESNGIEVIEPASLKNVRVETPPGLIGSAKAAPKCTFAQFTETKCPKASQIGLETIILNTVGGGFSPGGAPLYTGGTLPLYNLTPPAGVPAEFATAIFNVVILMKAEVRSAGDYGLTMNVGPNSQAGSVFASETMFFGDPSRYNEGGATPTPFVYNPTFCGPPRESVLAVNFYQAPAWVREGSAPQGWTGCDRVPFAPTITVRPQARISDSPSGFDVDLHLPQSGDPEALASADLRDAVVTLPEGVAIDPSAATGLGACTEQQFEPPHGEAGAAQPAQCPDSAKIGSVEIDTPLLDHPIPGAVYVAQPGENRFGSLLAIYVAGYDPLSGMVVKLAGKVEADPVTGRLTTRFDDNPQLPFEDFRLHFFGGATAALKTPLPCGSQETTGTMTPWSGTPPQAVRDSYSIDTAAGGAACPADEAGAPNRADFEAGTTSTTAGAYAPFVLHLRRDDGTQRFRALNVDLPEGLLAKLAGVPYCPDAAIAAAGSRSAREEVASPSCPAASEVGSVTVAAGAGSQPFRLEGGRAYLAGPYKGAPLSLAIVTPALAGPYDLGTVVVRAALRVDPRTSVVSVVSDPIPTILQGIPLDLRELSVSIDRPGFTRNPTSCDPTAVGGEAISPTGATARLSSRFQVARCGSLAFKPRLRLALRGATGRSGHPSLRATLTFPRKGRFANVQRAQVGLPHSLFLDQGDIGTVCDQAHLASASCPKASIYGRAKAWTPLLDKPLEGPVYLGVGYGHKLPDLVADLDGQIRILLNARIDTTRQKGLRSTFEAVPDAPVTKFTLALKGGRRFGLIENSEDLCRRAQKASVAFTAHSGKRLHARPTIAVRCGSRR